MGSFSVVVLALSALLCWNSVHCDELSDGDVTGALGYSEIVELPSMEGVIRSKIWHYLEDEDEKTIKGYTAKDLSEPKSLAKIISGGVGSTEIKIRMKGDVGDAVKYQINLYF